MGQPFKEKGVVGGSDATMEVSTMNTKKQPLGLATWRSSACLISMVSMER